MPSISGLSTQIRAANPTDLEDCQDPTLGAASSRKIATFEAHAQFRNALAPRGGVIFDGTAGAQIYAPLTNQNLGTDPFSLVFTLRVPTANPVADSFIGYVGWQTSGVYGSYTADVRVTTDGLLQFLVQGASPSDISYWQGTANFVATWGGRIVQLAVVRPAAGAPLWYVNGIAQTFGAEITGGTAPGAQGTITSTYFAIGYGDNTASSLWTNPIYSATCYNLALSAADLQEIYERGGAVPERYMWGAAANQNTFTDAWKYGAGETGAVSTLGGGVGAMPVSYLAGARTGGAGSYFARFTNASGIDGEALTWRMPTPFYVTSGNKVMVRCWARSSDDRSFHLQLGSWAWIPTVSPDVSVQSVTSASWGQYSAILTANTTGGAWSVGFMMPVAAIGHTFDVDDLEIIPLGAIAHYACDDGLGYQLLDLSSNKLHATISPTGVTHIAARRSGRIRFSTSTAGNQQLLGQPALPPNARLRSWVVDSAGTPTVKLGTTSGGAELFAAAPLAAGLNDLALLTRFASTDSLYVNSTTIDLLQHTIDYDLVD